jgi:hypothetical protein
MGVIAPQNLAPRASRCRNIGTQGATVDKSNTKQLAYELVAEPGLLRKVSPEHVTHQLGAQYGRPVRELPYYVGIGFPKPYVSFGLDKSEQDAALDECDKAASAHADAA